MAMVRTGVLAEMLRNLENEAVAVVLGFERVQNLRQMAVELYVDDCAHNLANLTNLACHFPLQSNVQAIDSVTGTFPRVAFE